MVKTNHSWLLMMCCLLSICLFHLVSAIPSQQAKEGTKTPDTVAGKFLKLALEKAEQVKQEKLAYQKDRQEFKVQKDDGTRDDRQWAKGKNSNKDKQGH